MILESYAAMALEERRTVYSMLGLRVEALQDGSLKVSGSFGEETQVWETAGTSRRFFDNANPPLNKSFGFTLILREGAAPETSFRVLAGT